MGIDEDKEDEEINIDFSKIKNLFKKKKKEGEEAKKDVKEEKGSEKEDRIRVEEKHEEEKEDEENEAEIDFSKITNFFKRKKEKSINEEPREDKKKIEEVNKEASETEEDEEINIDFSKIRNLFKKKEKSETKEKVKSEEEEIGDEEISIDFGKIKNLFKGLKEKRPEQAEGEEEISLDIKKTIDFFNKHKKVVVPTLLIIIAIFFSVYLRIQPAYLPVTDDWAKNAAYEQIKSSIRSQIDKQYPNLPDTNKNSLVDAEFKKIWKEQKEQINPQIKATSDYFKSTLQNDKGKTHLLDLDTYFWVRHAQNVLKYGHPGDELRDGKPYDNHMYAPIGREVPPDMFHAYFQAYLYKFVRFFNKELDFITFVFYIPILLYALAIFPAFFIGRRLGGNFGGFVAAFIVAVHPASLARTAGGVLDTDVYNILFPLLITWLSIEAFENRNTKKIILYSGLAGFLVGLYSFAWGGWFYIFDFILFASVFYLFYFIVLCRNEIKNTIEFIKKPAFYNTLVLVTIFIISSALFTSIFTNFSTFKDAFLVGPLGFAKLKQVAITTIWPNVFTTVAEQNPASLDSVISQIGMGSTLLFLIGLTGITLTMLRKETGRGIDLWFILGSIIWFIIILGVRAQDLSWFLILISLPIIIKLIIIIKEKDMLVDIKAAILLVVWFIATIYASVKGVRFTLLTVPAFAIAFGVALGIGYYYLYNLITKGFKINKKISKTLVIILLCLLLLGPYRSGEAIAKNEIPLINDAWYNSLQKINLESEPDAIINSWWDYGHWFKMIGDRAVTFDGTSQGSPNAHWIGSVLLTNDEGYAVGLLRMVDCGQNKAFEELDKVIKDEPKSIETIEEIVRLNKEDAKSVLLKSGLSEEEADLVLKYTHCEPPEDYFIASYDMIGKSGVWAHFGSWDFNRALVYNTLKRKEYKNDLEKSISFLQNRFNYTRERAESIYYEVQSIKDDAEANSWIAPWPSYAGFSGCSKIENNTIGCGIGQGAEVKINLETLQADIQTSQGIMHPNSVVMPLKDGKYKERHFNNTIGVSMTLIPTGDESFQALISSQELAKSMFTIMFYLNGHGLKYFDKFSDVRDITGGRIIVWKVNWQGNSTNLLEYYQPKPIPEQENEEELTKELEEKLINKSKESLNESSEEIIEKENILSSINNSQDINTTDNSSG